MPKKISGAPKIPTSVIEAVVRETLSAKSKVKPTSKVNSWSQDDESSSSPEEWIETSVHSGHKNKLAGLGPGEICSMLEQGTEAKEIARLRRALQASSTRERVLVRENATLQVFFKLHT